MCQLIINQVWIVNKIKVYFLPLIVAFSFQTSSLEELKIYPACSLSSDISSSKISFYRKQKIS